MVVDTVANEHGPQRKRRVVRNLAYLPCRRNDCLSDLGYPTNGTLMFIVVIVVMVIRVLAGSRERWAVVVYSLTIRQRNRPGVLQQVQRWCNREGGIHQEEESSDEFLVLAGHKPFRLHRQSRSAPSGARSGRRQSTVFLPVRQGVEARGKMPGWKHAARFATARGVRMGHSLCTVAGRVARYQSIPAVAPPSKSADHSASSAR